MIKGESIKTSQNLRRTFGLISLPTNMLEGWDIFHLKGSNHISGVQNISAQYYGAEICIKQYGVLDVKYLK